MEKSNIIPLTKREKFGCLGIVLIIIGWIWLSEYSGCDGSKDMPCDIDNGAQSATVSYYNPKTGYKKTYYLMVEVEECNVVNIKFDNGGLLDDSHINPTEIDSRGRFEIIDDKGREFKINIDN